jgi:hypothetical protein
VVVTNGTPSRKASTNLQFHPRAVTQRHHGDTRAAIQFAQLGIADIGAQADCAAGQCRYLRRRFRTGDGESCTSHARANQRQHLVDEPQHAMPVRHMREASNEQDHRFRHLRPWGGELSEAVGQQCVRADLRLAGLHDRGFLVRWVHNRIDIPPDGSLQLFHRVGLACNGSISQLLRLHTHAAEMQIGAVIEQADPVVTLQLGQEVGSHLRPAQQRVVDIVSIVRQPLAECADIAAIGDLDAEVLQCLGVARAVAEIMWPELHHHADLQETADDAQHGA